MVYTYDTWKFVLWAYYEAICCLSLYQPLMTKAHSLGFHMPYIIYMTYHKSMIYAFRWLAIIVKSYRYFICIWRLIVKCNLRMTNGSLNFELNRTKFYLSLKKAFSVNPAQAVATAMTKVEMPKVEWMGTKLARKVAVADSQHNSSRKLKKPTTN